MKKILNYLTCMHLETIRKHDATTGKFCLACLHCPWESEGVLTGPAHQCYHEYGWHFVEEL